MIRTLATIALRLAVCVLVVWAARRWLGNVAMVTTLPIFGVALARPLLDFAGDIRDAIKGARWRHVQGRHYAFRDQPIRVVTDADHQRWVHLGDIRAIAGFTASDGALTLTYPNGARRLGKPAELHLSDEALLAHLRKERAPDAVRLCLWVEREIVFPARRERERLGIRIEAVDFRPSD
jgi:hypothetical protein